MHLCVQTDVIPIPFPLQIWQDVWDPQLSVSIGQDPSRDGDIIYSTI